MENIDKFGGIDRVPVTSKEVAPGVRRVDPDIELSASERGIEYRKFKDCCFYYIGKDGHDYSTYDTLQEANRLWMAVNCLKIPTSKFPH